MAQPDSGEYSVRSLAEILREHGLETELGTRPGRRRRTSDDPDATGRSPRVEQNGASRPQAPAQAQAPGRAPAQRPAPGQAPAKAAAPGGAAASQADAASQAAAARAAASQAAAAKAAASTSAPAKAAPFKAGAPATPQVRHPAPVWPEEQARPAAGLAGPATPVREPAPARPPAATPPPARTPAPAARAEPAPRDDPAERMSATGPVGDRSAGTRSPLRPARRKSDTDAPSAAGPGAAGGPSTSAIPALGAAARREAHPVTGPIPVQRPGTDAEDEEPLTGRESVLAWARFAGELVVALAVGIGLFFAFTVLWELVPYVALVAAPLSVTALVAGVAAWRRRTGQGELGVRLLAVLLLAGTVLVIAPAAGLLAA